MSDILTTSFGNEVGATEGNEVIYVTGPQGPAGPAGATGATGPAGPTGAQGIPGETQVLRTDNTTPYTPTADYHPATKKYVNDTISAKRSRRRAMTHSFESMDSGWVNWYGGASAIHDTTIKNLGTASIQLPCPTAGTNVGMRKNITDLDLSGFYGHEFYVRSTNWSNIVALEILLGNTGFAPNYWLLDLKTKISADTMQNDTWIPFTFSKADFVLQTGVLDWANTQDMIVRARSTPGTTPTAWIESYRFTKQLSQIGYVLFCADDGWADQSNLLDIADKYGHKVCLFVIPSAIGTAGYFTQSQIDDAHNRGHIIAMHGATALTSLTGAALTTEINTIRAYRDAHPEYRGGHMFALPEGKINAEVEAALTPYFKYIFSIDEQKAYPYDNESLRIPRRSLLNTTSTVVAQGLMDDAMDYNGMQILNFHHVITTPVISTDYSIADTDTLFSYASTPANNINVGDWMTLFP